MTATTLPATVVARRAFVTRLVDTVVASRSAEVVSGFEKAFEAKLAGDIDAFTGGLIAYTKAAAAGDQAQATLVDYFATIYPLNVKWYEDEVKVAQEFVRHLIADRVAGKGLIF